MPIRPFQPQYIHAPRDFQPIENTPIFLEIGAGKGKHALLLSEQFPQKTIYAVERTREKFTAMQKLYDEQLPQNLHLVHADVIAWAVHAVYPQQIEQCFLLYPNPEPHNPAQRWLNMPFFEFLLSRLRDGASITLASNIAEYIAEAEQQLQQRWKLPYLKQQVEQHSARTHFEIKYLQRGESCQQLIIEKPIGYRTRFDDVLPRLGQSA